jgi:AraC family transcriptional regulator, arabinose operon regulatory protein
MYNFMGHSYEWDERGIRDVSKPLIVANCGYQKFITKNHRISRSKGRLDYQIIYIVEGKGYFTFDGKTQQIGAGNIIIYKPHEPQLYEYHHEDSTELFWMHLTGYAVHNYLERAGLLDQTVYYVDISADYVEIYRKIIYELLLKNAMFEYIASAFLMELLFLFSRKVSNLKTNNRPKMNSAFRNTIDLMHSEYSVKYSVKDYADKCNLSVCSFIHKFKAITGMSPLEYTTRIRVDEAKYLLANSSFNLSEISSIVGYDNPLYFSRVFKKATGFSPSKYKKANISKIDHP